MRILSGPLRALLFALPLAGTVTFAHAQTLRPADAYHTILLIRHGAYAADPDAGELGAPLNPLGIAQARLLAARLAAAPGPTAALLSSPLLRAHETARVIAEGLSGPTLEIVPELAECRPLVTVTEAGVGVEDDASRACAARLDALFERYVVAADDGPRRTILVAHGNVIRYLVTRALGVDATVWQRISVGHASVTQLVASPDGGVQVVSVGDVGHLPAPFQTGATGQGEAVLMVPEPR